MTRAWMVRGGRHGEREELALDKSVCGGGWIEVGDLSGVVDRDTLSKLVRAAYADRSKAHASVHVGQLWRLTNEMQVGDIVVMPRKKGPVVIGTIAGPYEFRNDLDESICHVRPVSWVRTDLPRTSIGQDLIHSLSAMSTICELKRANAVERFKALMETGTDPGAISGVGPTASGTDGEDGPLDLDEVARDQLRSFISQHFAGHDLARLVESVLIAQGYTTFRSPPGPDAGIDVLAGSGPLGLDSPRICVQVKSGSQIDVKVVRELQGVIGNVGADQGLLVAWGGLTKPAADLARTQFFKIRVWDADSLIEAVTSCYSQLSAEVQAELPLKQIWMVVHEADVVETD